MTDNQFLQDLLDKGGEVVFPSVNPNNGTNLYEITEPLVLKSNTSVTLDGCVLRLKDGVFSNVFITEGAWEANPVTTRNVEIIGKNGSLIDGGEPNGLTERNAKEMGMPIFHNNFILFFNVDGFKVTNLKFQNPRHWNLNFYHCCNGTISDINFNSANNVRNQDGIDLRRGCHHILIENITGSTGDDTVALTALDGFENHIFNLEGADPDVHDIIIRNIKTDVTGGHGIIRLLCHDGIKMYNIEVRDVYDTHIDNPEAKKNIGAVRIGDVDYWKETPCKVGEMHDIIVDGVTTNTVPLEIALHIPNLILNNIKTTKEF